MAAPFSVSLHCLLPRQCSSVLHITRYLSACCCRVEESKCRHPDKDRFSLSISENPNCLDFSCSERVLFLFIHSCPPLKLSFICWNVPAVEADICQWTHKWVQAKAKLTDFRWQEVDSIPLPNVSSALSFWIQFFTHYLPTICFYCSPYIRDSVAEISHSWKKVFWQQKTFFHLRRMPTISLASVLTFDCF